MRFIRGGYPPNDDRVVARTAYLVGNSWDDYGFRTTFGVYLVDDDGTKHDLDGVQIITMGMTGGYVEVSQDFDEPLPENYCSLGSGQNY